jgi:hypothetical protein
VKADDFPGPQIHQKTEIQEAFIGTDTGYVSRPCLVRATLINLTLISFGTTTLDLREKAHF